MERIVMMNKKQIIYKSMRPLPPILLFYKMLHESEIAVFYHPENYKEDLYKKYGFVEMEFHELPKHFETLYVKSNAIFPLCILANIIIEKLIIMAKLKQNVDNFNLLMRLENLGCQLDLRISVDAIWYANECRKRTIENIINS
jgi:hypothetical protein